MSVPYFLDQENCGFSAEFLSSQPNMAQIRVQSRRSARPVAGWGEPIGQT
jgi:hypothetical protein